MLVQEHDQPHQVVQEPIMVLAEEENPIFQQALCLLNLLMEDLLMYPAPMLLQEQNVTHEVFLQRVLEVAQGKNPALRVVAVLELVMLY